MRTNPELKYLAREHIRLNFMRVLLISAAYIVVTYLMSYLSARITGLQTWAVKYMEVYQSQAFMSALSAGDASAFSMLPPIPEPAPLAAVIAALLALASVVLDGGFIGWALMRVRGTDAGFMDLFSGMKNALRIILISLITGVIVGLGFLLFIVPGVILAYRYRLAYYVMFDNPEMGAIACLRESGRLMSGNKLRLFLLDLSFLGWIILSSLLGALGFPLLDIWLTPYLGLARALFYTDLVPDGSWGRPLPASGE